jgi:polyphosphate kinase
MQEAKDPRVPLFERIKFLAIFSSNLDEFFRVRMANHRNLHRVGKKTLKQLEYNPKEIIEKIQQTVNHQQEEYSSIFEEQIVPALEKQNIFLLRRLDLNEEQKEFVENYFQEHMLPFVQPVLLVGNKIRPFLNNAALYLTVLIKAKDDPNAKKQVAIVKIPSDHLPRFISLPSPRGVKQLIFLDDIVRHSISWMFPGFYIIETYSIKLTRDAELYLEDEWSGDLMKKIKASLSKRHVGPASRLIYDREMPEMVLDHLKEVLELDDLDLLKEGRYHNNSDFFKFPDFGLTKLKDPPQPPMHYAALEKTKNFYASLRERDHFNHVPYQSYESVVRFFEEAADDPNVTHIKIVQYRVASKSRIMQALIKAVKAGKQVSAFIEIKARFDEAANLSWGEKLEKAGVTVNYSMPGLKVHSKLALVRRVENRVDRLYAYMATGNFHEGTATLYSDMGIFTSDPRIVNEAARVFSYLETKKLPVKPFQHLLVGQFNLRPKLASLIDYEIAQAEKGKKAEIILKMNSLQDPQMIDHLYRASQAGVKVKLIIRGICCLVPGVKGLSENIEAISIVDRYLEHARVFIYHHGGKKQIYLSSADWMTRNLSHRVETAFPVYSREIRKQILDLINIQLCDSVKARLLDQDQNNNYKTEGCSDINIRTQIESYYYVKRILDADKKKALAAKKTAPIAPKTSS